MKKTSDTKAKIVEAAWKLFYNQGFENTTVEDIVEESHTSKGSFYHYFSGKNALLSSLADLFDKKYEELSTTLDYSKNCVEMLSYLNKELFSMIDDQIDIELMKLLYSTQLTTDKKELLDHKRFYYKLLKKIVQKGQEKGDITTQKSANEIVRSYAYLERGAIYEWCLCDGEFPLKGFSNMLRIYLDTIKV